MSCYYLGSWNGAKPHIMSCDKASIRGASVLYLGNQLLFDQSKVGRSPTISWANISWATIIRAHIRGPNSGPTIRAHISGPNMRARLLFDLSILRIARQLRQNKVKKRETPLFNQIIAQSAGARQYSHSIFNQSKGTPCKPLFYCFDSSILHSRRVVKQPSCSIFNII